MQYFICFIQDFYESIGYKKDNFKFNEPFEGLFTQGMVVTKHIKMKKEIG